MFSQPVTSPPLGPQPATPASPTRPSRLRGLTYLRNYTHHHLLSRDSGHHSNSGGGGGGGGGGGAAASVGNTNTNGNGRNSTSPGRSGAILTRSTSYTPAATPSAGQNPNRLTLVNSTPDMPTVPTRHNATALAIAQDTALESDSLPPPPSPTRALADPDSATNLPSVAAAMAAATASSSDTTPTIRFSAHYDPRTSRPSLSFPPISRALPFSSDIIRVGRYSERGGHATALMAASSPTAAPVGFKSKVVSRRHCEFWCEDDKWYIKDVKSSSGTFLNHIRLSPPSQESRAYPVNDGDIVQLGIDFKGGEEVIFRCVKMRLELNRGWQNKLNSFNVAAHKRLRNMASNGAPSSLASANTQDCSICLNSIAPCQSLFVAPCSHTWHFKCVRSLLTSPKYPIFLCPNCRAGADLEADVEESGEDWQQMGEGRQDPDEAPIIVPITPGPPEPSDPCDSPSAQDTDAMDLTVNVGPSDSPAAREYSSFTASAPLPISTQAANSGRVNQIRGDRSPSPQINGDGPLTPLNNAGPWVFDGRAGRRATSDMDAQGAPGSMANLNAAADA